MSTRRIIIIVAAVFLLAGNSLLALPTGFNALNYKGKITTGSDLTGQMGANTITDDVGRVTSLPRVNTSEDPHLVTGDNTAVPEPATIALFGLGALGLGFFRRRKS